MLHNILIIFVLCGLCGTSLIDPRFKRQTVVTSNANSDGKADTVETNAMAHHFKEADGTVGQNISSGGNATGADSASMNNNLGGSVGSNGLNATGNVGATGTNSQASSDIFSSIYGDNITLSNYQQGKAEGVGDSSALASGGGQITKDGVPSTYGNDKGVASAGSTGSLGSSAEVISNQQLTWDSILAQLVGSAVAEGLGNAQANVDLAAGNQQNGVEVNGVVSGWNNNNGNVNAQVNGNAQMNNNQHNLTGNMYGNVNGTGNSNLVGATNLQSNVTGQNNTINMFGESNVQTDGNSSANLLSESELQHGAGANGNILMNATADGANKNMTVQNGIKVNDVNGGTLGIGHGSITGNGTLASNGSITVESNYTSNGEVQVVSNADGNSKSDNGNNSTLNINNQVDLSNSNGVNSNGQANAGGVASGQNSNLTGNGFINVGTGGSNGNAVMEGFAGGEGPSSIETNAALSLKDGDGNPRNTSVSGGVSASGDKTSVHSISVVTDYQGMQTLSNYQKATSTSSGSGSSSASNTIVLRRKRALYSQYGISSMLYQSVLNENPIQKRKVRSLGALYEKLF